MLVISEIQSSIEKKKTGRFISIIQLKPINYKETHYILQPIDYCYSSKEHTSLLQENISQQYERLSSF